MAVYAIGDIQGCLTELQALLDKISYEPNTDQLWFVGDLVNRGPQSLEALRFIKSLPDTIITLGNHDLSLLAQAYTDRKPGKGDTLEAIFKAPDRDELLHWLRQQKLFHRDKQLGYNMVHAGLPPQWKCKEARGYAKEVEAVLKGDNFIEFLTHMYGNRPSRWSQELEGMDRLRFITNALTRLRFCTADGKLDMKLKGPPGSQENREYMPWFDIKKRASRNKKIIFGHWSTLGLVHRNNVYAIDTGCLWGGKLTALRLDCDIPEITQVNSVEKLKPL